MAALDLPSAFLAARVVRAAGARARLVRIFPRSSQPLGNRMTGDPRQHATDDNADVAKGVNFGEVRWTVCPIGLAARIDWHAVGEILFGPIPAHVTPSPGKVTGDGASGKGSVSAHVPKMDGAQRHDQQTEASVVGS